MHADRFHCSFPLVAAERRRKRNLLIRMLAQYVEWHMRERLARFLFVGEEKQEGEAGPVGPAERSEAGNRKDTTRRTLEGDHPPNCFEDLLESFEGVTAAELRMDALAEHRVSVVSTLTPWRKRVCHLLGIRPHPAPSPGMPAAESGGT